MELYNLSQLVKKPTRITPTSKTLIDIILTTNSNMCVNTDVLHLSLSDHSLVETVISRKPSVKSGNGDKHVQKEFRSFKNFNIDDFAYDLNCVNWEINDSLSVASAWDNFVNKFTAIYM